MVPTNKFVNTVEFVYDFVNSSIAEDVIGEGFKKYVPFLVTIFFFILVCNILGLRSWLQDVYRRHFVHLGSRSHFVRVLQLLWHEDFWFLPVLPRTSARRAFLVP